MEGKSYLRFFTIIGIFTPISFPIILLKVLLFTFLGWLVYFYLQIYKNNYSITKWTEM